MADETQAGINNFISVDEAISLLGLKTKKYQIISIEKLTGGLTNDNVLVTLHGSGAVEVDKVQRKVVIRRFSKRTSQHLSYDRRQEFENSKFASEVKKVGAPVVGFMPPTADHGGALALEYVEGTTMDEEKIQRLCSTEAGVTRLTNALRALHKSPAVFGNTFDPFKARQYYEEQVQLLSRNDVAWKGYHSAVQRLYPIQEYLAKSKEPLVDCHNDLLSANFLDSTNGIVIIDWELSGRAEPSWELGNFISENGLDGNEEAIRRIISSYWSQLTPQEIESKIKRAKLFSIVSKITWAAWGAILHHLDNVDSFNYQDWSMKKLIEADKALSDQDGIAFLCSD